MRSEFETRTLKILKPIRTPGLVPNHRVDVGSNRYYLDFAFPTLRLGIECQSARWHLGTEAQRSDNARMRKLMLAGWSILPFCWDDVRFDPAAVQGEVEEAIRLRSLTLFD